MTFSSMLRRFGPAATLIAIRSAVVEPYTPRPASPQHDPSFGGDPLYLTARAGIQCARAYKTINEIRTVAFGFESWSELREAGFPPIEVDEPAEVDVQPDDLDTIGEEDPYTEEPLFEIPGFKPVLKIHGRKTDLTAATVGDAVAYRDMCIEMHGNFGRTVEQVKASVEVMLDGCDGDLDANAVEAWKRGNGEDDDESDAAEGEAAA